MEFGRITSSGNLLDANPGFENTSLWSEVRDGDYPGTAFFRSTWGMAAPHGGSYAYTISNQAYGSLNSDMINVSASTTYDAYAWVRGETDPDESVSIWMLLLRHYDSGSNLIRTDTIDQGAAGTLSTTWQQKGGRFTTPANGAKVRIELWLQLSSGWVAFDDVSLRPVITYNLSYDAENRLTSVSGATTASFVYDGDGKRVKATVSGVTTVYVGNYFEWTGSTSTMVKYYSAGGARIAMRVGAGTGTTGLSWLLSDHLGSTNVATDGAGANPIMQRYKTWGETRFSSGTLPTKRQYTGQINETGLGGIYFYGARWWDPALGRFLSADTIIPLASQGLQAWDRYAGMNNNPIRYVDPTGYGVCDGPYADPECAAVKKTPINKLPGWNPWYGQKQSDDQGCFPTATAAALSTIMGGQVSAAQIDIAMERDIWKLEAFGVPPILQDNAINTLADRGLGDFSATYSRGTREDLIENLDKGLPTVVSVSWGYTNEMGHALLVIAYNQSTRQFSFFDPATGMVITEQQFFKNYGITFGQAWLSQPTIFIPSGSMVTITP